MPILVSYAPMVKLNAETLKYMEMYCNLK